MTDNGARSEWPRWQPLWPQSEQPGHLVEVLYLVEEWERRGKSDAESVLRDINEANLRFVPGAQCAGITTLDVAGAITTVGATDERPRHLDDVQRETEEGPCLSAAWEQHILYIPDLTTDFRWPRFRRAAIDRTTVRSVLSVRLFADDGQVGALNFMAHAPGAFDQNSIEAGLLVATHTTAAWNMLHLDESFRIALAGRDLVDQAKGVLMERFDINAVTAFELLKRLSELSDMSLVDVARKLIGVDDYVAGVRIR